MGQRAASPRPDCGGHGRARLLRHHRRARHVHYVFHRGRSRRQTLARSRHHRRGTVHSDHGHFHHRRRAAQDSGGPRLHLPRPQLGIQRLRRRFRRAAAARWSAIGPVRRAPDLRRGWAVLATGSLAAGLASSPAIELAGRAVQGAGVCTHRTGGAEPSFHCVRRFTERADQGPRHLWRRSAGRRDGRRVPRRRTHGIRVMAMGVLHQHSAGCCRATPRSGRASQGRHSAGKARRRGCCNCPAVLQPSCSRSCVRRKKAGPRH